MQINSPEKAIDYHREVGDFREGTRVSKSLLVGKENTPNNYKLSLGGGGDSSDWTTPRHRHTFEQIRYVVSGDYVIRKDEVLPTGWVAYFPESVYYGPQVKSANLYTLGLQFGGPTGIGYWSAAQRKKATQDLLAKGGEFKDGMYVWTGKDGKVHQQDASEAVEEQANGKAVAYPPQRYSDLVIMNPASFSWIKDRDTAGVAHKRLGRFTERDVRVSFIRMDKGAVLNFGQEKSPEALFLKEGKVAHDNQTYGAHTAFGTDTEEAPLSITAVEPSEFVYMKLPTY